MSLSGRLDTEKASSLVENFDELTDFTPCLTVVDLGSVEYISSEMIRILLKSLKRHRQMKGDLLLATLPQNVFDLLKMAGMDALFPIFETREAALESFKK